MSKKNTKLNQSQAIKLAGEFTAGNVLLKLSHYKPRYEVPGEQGLWSAPTIQHLAKELLLGRDAVRRAMDRLAQEGLIEVKSTRFRGIPRVYWRVCPVDHMLRKMASDAAMSNISRSTAQQAIPQIDACNKEQNADTKIDRNRHMPSYRGLSIKTMPVASSEAENATSKFSGGGAAEFIGPRKPPLPYNPRGPEVQKALVAADILTVRRGWGDRQRMDFLKSFALRIARERYRRMGSEEPVFNTLSLSIRPEPK